MVRSCGKKLIVIGAGAYAREVIDAAVEIGFDIEGVISDLKPKFDIRLLGTFSDIEACNQKNIPFFFAIGATDRKSIQKRDRLFEDIAISDLEFVNIISSSSHVSKSVKFGRNNYVAPGVIINSGAVLHDNILVNNNATIGHDVIINSNSVISGNVFIGGNTFVGSNVLIGPGANILQGLNISDQAVISVGATVLRSLKTGQTIYPNFNTIVPKK